MTRLFCIATLVGAFLAYSAEAEAKSGKGGSSGRGAGSHGASGSKGSGSSTSKGMGNHTNGIHNPGNHNGGNGNHGNGNYGNGNHGNGRSYPRGYNGFGYRGWSSTYGCEMCWSGIDGCYFYYYAPSLCYLPITYIQQYPPVAAAASGGGAPGFGPAGIQVTNVNTNTPGIGGPAVQGLAPMRPPVP